MSNAKDARERSWADIEHKHRLKCLWSQIMTGGKIQVECMWAPLTGTILMVVKHYDKPIPRRMLSTKEWPEMTALYVYAPIGGASWESLDKAIADLPRPTE